MFLIQEVQHNVVMRKTNIDRLSGGREKEGRRAIDGVPDVEVMLDGLKALYRRIRSSHRTMGRRRSIYLFASNNRRIRGMPCD